MSFNSEVRDRLIALSQGSNNTSSPDEQTARSRRTSFMYSSQPTASTTAPVSLSQSDGAPTSSSAAAMPTLETPRNSAEKRTHHRHHRDSGGRSGRQEQEVIYISSSSTEEVVLSAPTSRAVASPHPEGHESNLTSDIAESSPASLAAPAKSGALVLDETQLHAVQAPIHRALLLQAGAGSGKTQTMASRITHLLEQGVPPWRILGICFTRQAAETLRERVRSTLPPHLWQSARMLKLKTMHSFGLECLRRYNVIKPTTQVYDTRKQRELAIEIVKEYDARQQWKEAVTELLDYIDKTKSAPTRQCHVPHADNALHACYIAYEVRLHQVRNAIDFNDLLYMMYQELLPPQRREQPLMGSANSGEGGGGPPLGDAAVADAPSSQPPESSVSPMCEALRSTYTHIIVDEFQDFSKLQFEILALLSGDACRVTCVGDPNQCIYEWRGAVPAVFDKWESRFPQTARATLGVNYRSDQSIVNATNAVVKASQVAHYHRYDKPVTLVRCVEDMDEATAIPILIEYWLRKRDPSLRYRDVAILCRTRHRVSRMVDLLNSKCIPVRQLSAAPTDEQGPMRAAMALLRLCATTSNAHSNADVLTVLAVSPQHRLKTKLKDLGHTLAAVAAERRNAETERVRQWRRDLDDGRASHEEGVVGVRPDQYSFFGLLREYVDSGFAEIAFPKLDALRLSKPSKLILRKLVTLVLTGQDMLERSGSKIEPFLKYVLSEGGFDQECSILSGGVGDRAEKGSGRKRGRSPPSRAGASLSDAVIAQFNQQISNQEAAEGDEETWSATPPPRKMSMAMLLLEAHDRVMEAIHEEMTHDPPEAQQLIAQSTNNINNNNLGSGPASRETSRHHIPALDDDSIVSISNLTTPATLLERSYPPSAILSRVLDEFLLLSPLDDIGFDGRETSATAAGAVTVGTVHRAKGMEWPAVILPGCWEGEFPVGGRDAEERRVFYVAMSRAMTQLVCITATHRAYEAQSAAQAATKQLRLTPYLDPLLKDMEQVQLADLQQEHLQHQGQI